MLGTGLGGGAGGGEEDSSFFTHRNVSSHYRVGNRPCRDEQSIVANTMHCVRLGDLRVRAAGKASQRRAIKLGGEELISKEEGEAF